MHHSTQITPRGAWEARRRIKLPALRHTADARAIERVLGALPGVRRVAAEADRHQVTVLYDATVLDYHAVETGLETAGFPPAHDWWSRFKAECFQYSDTNARENAATRPSPCCNKPPK